jgi:hypothetical protein
MEDRAVAAGVPTRVDGRRRRVLFAPDAEQDWAWITPGAVVGTLLWVVVSLLFKVYVANFADYNRPTARSAESSCFSCGSTSQVSRSSWVRR